MTASTNKSPHEFHIPVLGTGFSIDTPLKVARYGISSVISLVDDVLIEQVRKFHCQANNEPYEEITSKEDDARAKRITAYLNLVDKLVTGQVKELQAAPFEPESEITKYFEMLPDGPLKDEYAVMLATEDDSKKTDMQTELRKKAVPGSIDVNIMTKLDVAHYKDGNALPREHNDAMAALRGYAESTLNSALVFSAGINQHLYTYLTEFKDFFADKKEEITKRITLKVSDYRSAVIQGKILAKKGLWVSEFRIESGLNCGGHAFATKGNLIGPILEEFKHKKDDLIDMLHGIYNKARESIGMPAISIPHDTIFSVQGGICTYEETELLKEHYGFSQFGWGTPFLLVPEAVNIDADSLERLIKAERNDTELSKSSPVGIPYWNLKTSASEEGRVQRIDKGVPGAPCPKGYLCFNEEYTKRPICTASKAYQTLKLEELSKPNGLNDEQKEVVRRDVLAKNCICHELGGATTFNLGIDKTIKTNICPGPIIGYFDKKMTLQQMVDHIYGRASHLKECTRPHMMVEEMRIYFEHLSDEIERVKLDISHNTPAYLKDFKDNMLEAVQYYLDLAGEIIEKNREQFIEDVNSMKAELEKLSIVSPSVA
ncbi:hypothetical protein BVX97_01185 [bacterium E08(2017)]|nr:hypothetical protein BVX97_01185 [bacterium E08(2017)]